MGSSSALLFGPFRLDPEDQCLRRGARAIPLAPKAFSVLHLLASSPGRLVTKEELLGTVWADTHVTEAVLKTCVLDIRRALGDDSRAPRFVETAHRRGYRFVGQVRAAPRADGAPAAGGGATLVGREGVLEHLARLYAGAREGHRQVVFLSGEVGIGKTAVVEAFLAGVAADPEVWTARGQCLEQYGAGEGYLPVLEALGRLCRAPGREDLVALLGSHAPTWLAQMPWLVGAARRESLRRDTLGATRDRMLRELAEVLETLTAERTLVLVLEDLQWSDPSTLDLLAVLARRREAARLVVLGTYRPVEVIVAAHPLRSVHQELRLHGLCTDVPLELLDRAAVERYLALRFPGHAFPAALADALERRTEGNPLFLVTVADVLVGQGDVAERDGSWQLTVPLAEIERHVPDSLRRMIEQQVDRLDADDRRVLEAAAVAGIEFSAAAVAAALEADLLVVEDRCQTLARRGQFLAAAPTRELPDGTPLARYEFVHGLHQHVLHDGVPPARRARLHLAVGSWLEGASGARAADVAAELAVHFEHGRDDRRAIRHLRRAADTDLQRHANREALAHLERALRLVDRLPAEEARGLRPAVQEHVGLVRRTMGDMAGAAADFAALVDWARGAGDAGWEAKALLYFASARTWADPRDAKAASDRALALSPSVTDPVVRAHVRGYAAYWNLTVHGWRVEDARACADAVRVVRAADDRGLLGQHLLRLSSFQCSHAEYRSACATADEGLALALEAGNAYDYLSCQHFRARALFLLGAWGAVLETLRDALSMAERNGHAGWAQLFRLELAGLHLAAYDFTGAAALAAEEHARATRLGNDTGRMFSDMVLGLARLGLGELGPAREALAARLAAASNPDAPSWLGIARARLGLAEAGLAADDWEAARTHAAALRDLAAAAGERTYLGLALAVLVEAASRQRRWDAAEEHARDAMAALDGVEAPIAEWRVCATGARLAQQRRRAADARRLWARSARVVTALAASLEAAPALQRTFRESAPVREVLDRA